MSAIERTFKKYEYLSKEYAKKVFNYERYGYEIDDIIQEMNIKIYMSIIGYAKQWKRYQITCERKPVALEFWLRTALSNKVKDFIKRFNYERMENIDKLSIGTDAVDIGEQKTSNLFVNIDGDIAIINGVDILDGLKGERRKCYCMYAYGFTTKDLSKIFPDIHVSELIERHNNFLSSRKRDELLDYSHQKFEVHNFSEE